MKINSMRFPAENLASLAKFVRPFLLAWFICCAWIPNSTTAASTDPIKIGAVLPFSGGVELYGGRRSLDSILPPRKSTQAAASSADPCR
jgi:urea transport system substrate-binding protein